MKKYNCKLCNYYTDIKCNYVKHCESKRHHKNIKKNQNESLIDQKKSLIDQKKSLIDQNDSNNIEYFNCKHCNYRTKWKSNLKRHDNNCSKKKNYINNLETTIERQKEEINTIKKQNNKIIENQREEINSLTNELNDALKLVQEYQLKVKDTEIKVKDTEIKVKDTEIRCLKEMNQINISNSNSNNNNRTNITQFIINKYPNAKNVWVPDKVSGLENFASDKVEENVNKLLTNIYKRNIKPEERPIWCIDSARNKYLTRLDNLWHVDLYGLLFCEKVCRQLANRCSEYITGEGLEKLNEHDRIRSLTMITDLLGRKRLSGPIKGQFIVNSLEDEEESLQ